MGSLRGQKGLNERTKGATLVSVELYEELFIIVDSDA